MVARRHPKLAMVSPWPPQASGIADYAQGLRDELRRIGVSVDVYTNADGDTSDRVYTIPSVDDVISKLSEYDRILVQLGNHPHFHGYMLPIIAAHGRKCAVELHDIRLDHVLPGLNYGGDPGFTQRWMLANYGSDEAISNSRPVSDIVCRHASSVIAHSHYAAEWLRTLGVANIHVVDLAYDLSELPELGFRPTPEGIINVGVFGTFQESRQIPLVLEALAILHRQGVTGWHLHLVGRPCEGYEELLSKIATSGISDCVSVRENSSTQEFLGLMGAMDVHVALRSPTVGETSGVVVQGLILGLPTIVSDVGWYAELPSIVEKIPQHNGLYELTTALYRHIRNEARRLCFGSSTKAFATEAYCLRNRAEEITEILVNG